MHFVEYSYIYYYLYSVSSEATLYVYNGVLNAGMNVWYGIVTTTVQIRFLRGYTV